MLPAAVGEEDEGDSEALEGEEGASGAGEGGGGAEEDAVDTVRRRSASIDRVWDGRG